MTAHGEPEVSLRALCMCDLDDYRRWFTHDTEWMRWDAPWEPRDEAAAERFIARLQKRIQSGAPSKNRRFEIDCGARHVGWVSSYFIDENKEKLAVGINIPEADCRGQGVGRAALTMFLRILFDQGRDAIYCQTWSGNVRMLRLAGSLGFSPCEDRGEVIVRGEAYRRLTLVLKTDSK